VGFYAHVFSFFAQYTILAMNIWRKTYAYLTYQPQFNWFKSISFTNDMW